VLMAEASNSRGLSQRCGVWPKSLRG
jgi:hypothetical protein